LFLQFVLKFAIAIFFLVIVPLSHNETCISHICKFIYHRATLHSIIRVFTFLNFIIQLPLQDLNLRRRKQASIIKGLNGTGRKFRALKVSPYKQARQIHIQARTNHLSLQHFIAKNYDMLH